MTAALLAPIRAKLRIDPTGKVRLAFELDPLGITLIPIFECLTCCVALEWEPLQKWWDCPVCGYELTPEEGGLVLKKARMLMALTESDLKEKSGKWDFGTWLRRRLRRKAA